MEDELQIYTEKDWEDAVKGNTPLEVALIDGCSYRDCIIMLCQALNKQDDIKNEILLDIICTKE